MTPTIGRIVHVGYDLKAESILEGEDGTVVESHALKITNAGELPCRAAIVSGEITLSGDLPVTVMPAFQLAYPAIVDIHTGWHDPRNCPRQVSDPS